MCKFHRDSPEVPPPAYQSVIERKVSISAHAYRSPVFPPLFLDTGVTHVWSGKPLRKGVQVGCLLNDYLVRFFGRVSG